MRGARGRETGAYTAVREDFAPTCNEADRTRSRFMTVRYLSSVLISTYARSRVCRSQSWNISSDLRWRSAWRA